MTARTTTPPTEPRTVSLDEVKRDPARLIALVTSEPGTTVMIESEGTPRVAMISVAELDALRLAARREAGLQTIREIQDRYDGRNDDLTDDEIMEMAVRAGQEYFDDLAGTGKISFEHDES